MKSSFFLTLQINYEEKILMKALKISLLSFVIFVFVSQKINAKSHTTIIDATLKEILKNTQWNPAKIARGIVWKHAHVQQIFNSKQYINLIEIDISKKKQVDLFFVRKGFIKTGETGKRNNSIIAFNGSFFNTKIGGSNSFLKYKGKMIDSTNNVSKYQDNGAITISKNQKVSILPKPTSGWKSIKEETVLACGPVLLQNGDEVMQDTAKFVTNRHPRTALGVIDGKKLILMVVDGRSSESQGMSIPELAQVLKNWGCTSVINLDGGGSSAIWIKEKGIINHPSDNEKFDYEGERAVVTVLGFRRKIKSL